MSSSSDNEPPDRKRARIMQSGELPSSNEQPDLNKVMAAVGTQVFSFLPLGSLLRGSASPMHVNTIFYDNTFQCLGQAKNLSFTARHLTAITDKHLMALVKNIIEVSEASAQRVIHFPGNTHRRLLHDTCSAEGDCSCSIKTTHLDLSECRNLGGRGVYFCLMHMPDIESLIISSGTRFDAERHFRPTNDVEERSPGGAGAPRDRLTLPSLEHVDISGCRRINSNGIRCILGRVRGENIRSLDFSGCSSLIDENIVRPIVDCKNLESLNIAGSKVNTGAILFICYVHRRNLRCLNLRNCTKINLPLLLMAKALDILDLFREISGTGEYSRIVPHHVRTFHELRLHGVQGDERPSDSTSAFYAHTLKQAIRAFLLANHRNFGFLRRTSRQMHGSLERHLPGSRDGGQIFGQLEKLDIGLIGDNQISLQGCIAIIVHLNGGRLQELDLCGLTGVTDHDLNLLALSSFFKLRALRAFAVETHELRRTNLFWHLYFVTDLDLSHCRYWDPSNGGGFQRYLKLSRKLRTLTLDYTEVDSSAIESLLTRSEALLRLSVHGCRSVKTSAICAAKEKNSLLKLLDLDCRECAMDSSLSELRGHFPTLLKLNNRCTDLGKRRLNAHRSEFLDQVGSDGRERSKLIASARADGAMEGEELRISSRCSLLRTGFSQAKESKQEMFCCKTCAIEFGRFVCLNCVKHCHDGHQVFRAGFGVGYCDCCIFSKCRCVD